MDRDQVTATLELHGMRPVCYVMRGPENLRLQRTGFKWQLVWVERGALHQYSRWGLNRAGSPSDYVEAAYSDLTDAQWTNLAANLDNLLQQLDANS